MKKKLLGLALAGVLAVAGGPVVAGSGQTREGVLRGYSVRAGGATSYAAGRSYDQTCYGVLREDPADTARLDVRNYGAFFDCIDPGEWLFHFETADSYADSGLDGVVVVIDTDGNPSNGCQGYDFAVSGGPSQGALRATILSTPTCDSATWRGVANSGAEMQRPRDTWVGLLFPNTSIGSPEVIRWSAAVRASGATTSDDTPDTGSHSERSFGAPADPCTFVSSADGSPRRYAVGPDAPAIQRTLGASGLRELVNHGAGVVTFAGDVRHAERALSLSGISARVGTDWKQRWHETPNDTKFAQQWNLPAVNAVNAWNTTHGSANVVVADVDSGFDSAHPELVGKFAPGGLDATNGQPLPAGNSDNVGHGTATAGVIAAATGNNAGIASLGWDTRVLPIKAGDEPEGSVVMAGIRYAADQGARVVNLSLGSPCRDQGEADAVIYAQQKGVLVVASAGNSGDEDNRVQFPAAYPGVVAVGATAHDGTLAVYSNRGAYLDIVAPGGTGDRDPTHDMLVLAPGGGTVATRGTSFSAPMISAAAALVMAISPDATPPDVARRLQSTVTDRGAPGHDESFGAGALDADRAVSGGAVPASPVSGTSDRLFGQDRMETAIAISQNLFASAGAAPAAVLARADLFPDALAGAPLARAKAGPLLLTASTALDSRTATELQRAVTAGGTVHLLGGTVALSTAVENQVRALGFQVVRYAGANRFETAVRIARDGIGTPSTFFIATGTSHPDALIAGAVAPSQQGAVLLTSGRTMVAPTSEYLATRPGTRRYAIGSEAAAASPSSVPIVGSIAEETAVMVAERFHTTPTGSGLASVASFPDALAGAVHAAAQGGPLLLTAASSLSAVTSHYFVRTKTPLERVTLFGGPVALAEAVKTAAEAAIR